MKMVDYLTQHEITHEAAARQLGISRVHLTQIAAGKKRPSLDLALRIERLTGGEVPVQSWATQPEDDAA